MDLWVSLASFVSGRHNRAGTWGTFPACKCLRFFLFYSVSINVESHLKDENSGRILLIINLLQLGFKVHAAALMCSRGGKINLRCAASMSR